MFFFSVFACGVFSHLCPPTVFDAWSMSLSGSSTESPQCDLGLPTTSDARLPWLPLDMVFLIFLAFGRRVSHRYLPFFCMILQERTLQFVRKSGMEQQDIHWEIYSSKHCALQIGI